MKNVLNNVGGTAIVSMLVLIIFGGVMLLAMFRTIPDTQAMSLLVGGIMTMASTVVSYWCGSSSGSAAKDATIHAAITQKPAQDAPATQPGATP